MVRTEALLSEIRNLLGETKNLLLNEIGVRDLESRCFRPAGRAMNSDQGQYWGEESVPGMDIGHVVVAFGSGAQHFISTM